MKILVMSCDKNEDLFSLFYHCIEKYWPEHPEVIYSTETVTNPFYTTINKDCDLDKWTTRLRETVKEIDDKFILVMCDDIFIRETVDNDTITGLVSYFDKNTAAINFENHFDYDDIDFNNLLTLRPENGKYKTSMMFQLWKKDKLLNVLKGVDTDPWKFEQLNPHKDYKYYCNANSHTGLIDFGKVDRIYNWGIVQGKWTREAIRFFKSEGIDIDYSKRGILTRKVFGIVSYFSWDQPQRKQRQDRLDRLVGQLSELWPDVPIMIISQQWKHYTIEGKCKNKIIRYDYPKLGILKARQELRVKFLNSDYDYMIMFDDDAIIECDNDTVAKEYMDTIDRHPDSFCFIKGKGSSPYTDYADSQLNLCAISKDIYTAVPLPNIDPQKSEGFEDRVFSTLLHCKYGYKEFDAPEGIRCTHFKNPTELVPSTWAHLQPYNWKGMRQKTLEIEEYINTYGGLPEWLVNKK